MKELSWENGIRLTQVLTSQHRFLRKAERQTVEQSPALELQSDEQRRGGCTKLQSSLRKAGLGQTGNVSWEITEQEEGIRAPLQ